ncbi:hypothetical protein ACWDV4_16335 [Micromonospora sp. NPDC003197]
MGFGYKTTWIAVRDVTVNDVAAALGLELASPLPWSEGVEAAYRGGVYVAGPVSGWVLAHGADTLSDLLDATTPEFVEQLAQLSAVLGEVQFFGTHRVVEYHAWAHARAGQVLRAYCYVGESGEVPQFVGEPSDAERELGVGTRPAPADLDDLTDDEWDEWFATTPDEEHVMQVASRWSVDPSKIDDLPSLGLYGATKVAA